MENKTVNWSDTQKILALFIISAFIAVILIWIFLPPKGDPGSIAVLNTLVGTLGGAFMAIVGYFFGSSKSSNDKDDTIKTIAMATPVSPPSVPTAWEKPVVIDQPK